MGLLPTVAKGQRMMDATFNYPFTAMAWPRLGEQGRDKSSGAALPCGHALHGSDVLYEIYVCLTNDFGGLHVQVSALAELYSIAQLGLHGSRASNDCASAVVRVVTARLEISSGFIQSPISFTHPVSD
jgi:hypothetical protein